MLQKIWRYLIPVAAALLAGGLAALLTQGDFAKYAAMEKPPLSPPALLFPIVWTILYTLMGISMAIVILSDAPTFQKRKSVKIYAWQLFFNFLWSILFFRFDAYLLAFFWIVILFILIAAMIKQFYKISKITSLRIIQRCNI